MSIVYPSTKKKCMGMVFRILILTLFFSMKVNSSTQQEVKNQVQEQEKSKINKSIESHKPSLLESDECINNCVLINNKNNKKFFISEVNVENIEPAGDIFDDIIKNIKKMNVNDIFMTIKRMNNILVSKGFVTSNVSIKSSDLSKGKLNLVINWGYVSGWMVDSKKISSLKEELRVFQAMPFYKGKILNIKDIDQAIENLNNVNKNVKVVIVPDSKDGYSYLNIVEKRKNWVDGMLIFENSGSGDSSREGKYKYSISLSSNDLLLSLDSIYINYYTHHIHSDDGFDDDNIALNYTIPLGYDSFIFNANYSYNITPLSGYYGTYFSEGYTNSYSIEWDRVLFRSQFGKLNSFLKSQYEVTKNYLDESFIEVNSKPYLTTSFGLSSLNFLNNGSIYSSVSMDVGYLAIDGSVDSKSDYFYVMKTNNQLSKDFYDYAYTLSVNGQYTNQELLNNFKMSIGDRYSVRGFRHSPFSGDSGLVFRNTIKPKYPYNFFNVDVMPFGAFDFGVSYSNEKEESNLISGTSVGTGLTSENFDGKIAFNMPIYVQKTTENINLDRFFVDFSVSYNFWF